MGSERHTCFETECVMALQGHPRSLILAPIESAYAISYSCKTSSKQPSMGIMSRENSQGGFPLPSSLFLLSSVLLLDSSIIGYHPCRAPVRDSHGATELSWWSRNAAVPSREPPTDDVVAAFLAETNMLPLCRHGDPGTLQCVGCLTRRLRGNIPHVESTNLF